MLTWSTMLRRQPRPPAKTQEQVIQADGVTLDLPRRRAQVDGYLVHLPAREAALLGVLLTHPGRSCTAPRWQRPQETSTRHITATWTG